MEVFSLNFAILDESFFDQKCFTIFDNEKFKESKCLIASRQSRRH